MLKVGITSAEVQSVVTRGTADEPHGFDFSARSLSAGTTPCLHLTPQETALLPNYPNPFNPETWIPYQLAAPADVAVSIYAADGNLVRDT